MHATPRTNDRSYRCVLAFNLQIADTGVRPFVQLRAPSACRAARLAQWATGAQAVVEVIRLEEPRS